MKKYKVDYTFYNGDTWEHHDGSVVVEARDENEAREMVESRNCPWADYVVSKVTEAEA